MNCLLKYFRKFWARMNINAEPEKKLNNPINKTLSIWFQKINRLFIIINRLFIIINWLFLSVLWKKHRSNSFIKQWEIERLITQGLYWFTLNLSYIQSPETPGYFTKQSNTNYTTQAPKGWSRTLQEHLPSLKHHHYRSKHPLNVDTNFSHFYKMN